MPRGLGLPFNALWGATAASNLGDGLIVVLLPLIALGQTDSPVAVAGVAVASTAAWPLFGLLAGHVVDSVDHRRLLVLVNAVRVTALGVIAVAWASDQLGLAVLYVAALVLGASETFADTALTSMVPSVVPRERRGTANARLEATINVLNQLAGPPLAGALLALGVLVATGVTGGAYAVALVGLLLLSRVPMTQVPSRNRPPRNTSRSWSRTTAGMRAVWSDAMLRRLTLLTAGMNLVWGAWTAVFVLYAVAPGPLGLTALQYGLLLSGMAVGGLVAAPVIEPLARVLGVRTLLLLDLLGTVALAAPAALGWGTVPVAIGAAAAGAGATIWRTVVSTIRQNRVEQRLLGRVYAASRIVSWGALPVDAAAGGALAQQYDVTTALGTAATVALVLMACFLPLTRGDDLTAEYRGT